MSDLEIERKFLLAGLPTELENVAATRIDQGYLNADKERATRVRVTSDGQALLTVKGVSRGASRVEIETSIDIKAARSMLTMVEGSIVSKLRRKVLFDGNIWEVDVFLGDNEGLVVAEIELTSEDQVFTRPAWVGAEITQDERYANSSLAMRPFKEWPFEGVSKAPSLGAAHAKCWRG